jgi:hypothetical protein
MLLKTLTPLLAASLAAVSLASVGCSSSDPRLAGKDTNFFDMVTIKPDSFAHAPAYSATIHSNEIISRPNVSGTQVSLLCGLITYEDY